MLREKTPRWWWEAGEEGYRWLAGMLVLLLRRRCLSDARLARSASIPMTSICHALDRSSREAGPASPSAGKRNLHFRKIGNGSSVKYEDRLEDEIPPFGEEL